MGSDDEALKTDGDKDKTIFEIDELEKEDEADDDGDDTDDDEAMRDRDGLKDVFADCRDEEDADDDKTKSKIYVFARTDRRKEDW